MEFRILGPLEVADGDATVALGGVRQRTLLAILLLNANEVVSADRLIDELWGERSPESGRSALQVRVSHYETRNTKLDLARVLTALDRPEEAISKARAALELFLTKGDGAGADRTRALLDELGPRE
jgi:Transcriptional regulatory protein, C terminal